MKGYRLGDAYAERKLKTACGEVSYGRAALIPRGRGDRFSSLGRGVGSDPGRFLAVGGAVRDAVGHADELFGQSSDL